MEDEQTPKRAGSGLLWGALTFFVVAFLLNDFLTKFAPLPPPPEQPKETQEDQVADRPAVEKTATEIPSGEKGEDLPQAQPATSLSKKSTQASQASQAGQIEQEEVKFTLEDDTRLLELTNRGAAVLRATLKVNDDSGVRGSDLEILEPINSGTPHFGCEVDKETNFFLKSFWEVKEKTSNEVVFALSAPNGLTLEKTLRLAPNYIVETEVSVSGADNDVELMVYGPSGLVEDTNAFDLTYYTEGLIWGKRKKARSAHKQVSLGDLDTQFENSLTGKGAWRLDYDDKEYGVPGTPLDWIGSRNKYLITAMRPMEGSEQNTIGFLQPIGKPGSTEATAVACGLLQPQLAPHQTFTVQTYLGPRHEATLAQVDDELTQTFQGGILGPIKFLLLSILEFFYKIFNSYGVAIILLTFCVRLVIHPVTRRSQMKMQEYQEKMQKLKPKLDALKKKHANDKQAFAQEQMKLMRETNMAGGFLGGCLPLLLQMPIFLALYYMLQELIELRGTTFLWITDLSLPDRLFEMNFIVDYFNILPILNCLVMVFQFKRNLSRQKPATPEQEMQQKMMMYFMPFMMLFFFYSFSSGLVIYWIVSALVGILESESIRKKMNRQVPQATPVKVKSKPS